MSYAKRGKQGSALLLVRRSPDTAPGKVISADING
jgi:hypothetical protein